MLSKKESAQEAPCKTACPVGLDVPRYVRAISEGRFDAALGIIRDKLPFPSVCGRICFHPCERRCNANDLQDRGPIAIRDLKRFVVEDVAGAAKEQGPTESTGKAVAVVGAGPAGLTAAYYLRKKGHQITVFEKLSEPGGMVRYGIPDYRLPKDILAKEINAIKGIGIEIRTNSKIDSPGMLLNQGFDAVFVAIGAHKGISPGIAGAEKSGIMDCIHLMKEINSGKKIRFKSKVLVIGGGNAAIDAARCALRLGGHDVTLLYRRSREEMLASPEEIEAALAEGVKIEFLTLPQKITGQGDQSRLHCIHTQMGELDETGRRRPEPAAGTEFTIDADHIIAAVGQEPEIAAGIGLTITADNLIQVDSATLATGKAGIYAGGDAVSGPSSFIDAIAAGRQAAMSIDKYLGGNGKIGLAVPLPEDQVVQTELQGMPVEDRMPMPELAIDDRLKDFSPIELGFNEEQAIHEAKRCLRCDLPITINANNCTGCLTCVMRCSLKSEGIFSPAAAKISVIPFSDEKVNEISFLQECNTCGICARYCPHDAVYRGERRDIPAKAK